MFESGGNSGICDSDDGGTGAGMTPMAIEESQLTKGQLRKLNELRKSVGHALGDEVFTKWLAQQAEASAHTVDPVAERIEQALAGFADDRSLDLGRYGYTIRRARGKGASGFVAKRECFGIC